VCDVDNETTSVHNTASLWNFLINNMFFVDPSDVFFAHDSGTDARCNLQRTHAACFRRHSAKLFHFRTLVVRAVSVCDRLTAVMIQGEEIKGLTDPRRLCLWQRNTIT
jgi:hypothetical protein